MTPLLLRLLYELLDAHDDTARLATGREQDERWRAHLGYLRDLQRVARDALADSEQPSGREGRERCVDLMVDRYVSWREACAEVDSSYRRWSAANWDEEVLAFGRYRAALDHEERAARAYQHAVSQVSVQLACPELDHRACGPPQAGSADAEPD